MNFKSRSAIFERIWIFNEAALLSIQVVVPGRGEGSSHSKSPDGGGQLREGEEKWGVIAGRIRLSYCHGQAKRECDADRLSVSPNHVVCNSQFFLDLGDFGFESFSIDGITLGRFDVGDSHLPKFVP